MPHHVFKMCAHCFPCLYVQRWYHWQLSTDPSCKSGHCSKSCRSTIWLLWSECRCQGHGGCSSMAPWTAFSIMVPGSGTSLEASRPACPKGPPRHPPSHPLIVCSTRTRLLGGRWYFTPMDCICVCFPPHVLRDLHLLIFLPIFCFSFSFPPHSFPVKYLLFSSFIYFFYLFSLKEVLQSMQHHTKYWYKSEYHHDTPQYMIPNNSAKRQHMNTDK